jgi:hypothetical protein
LYYILHTPLHYTPFENSLYLCSSIFYNDVHIVNVVLYFALYIFIGYVFVSFIDDIPTSKRIRIEIPDAAEVGSSVSLAMVMKTKLN